MKFPENIENLKKCIAQCTSINIINSLENACSLLYCNMEGLFESSELSPEDYGELRKFIKRELETLTGK